MAVLRSARHLTIRRALSLGTLLLSACGGGETPPVMPPAPSVARVTVTPSIVTLDIGQAALVQAVAVDANGVAVSGQTFTYASTDTSVATVDATGSIMARKAGSTVVRATASPSAVTGASNVTVNVPPPVTFSVAMSGTGKGTVTITPPGLSCTGPCGASLPVGTTVTVTATPNANSAFIGWSGACTGVQPSCVVTMDVARSTIAAFDSVVPTYALSVQATGAGAVRSSPAGIDCPGTCSAAFVGGTTVTLTATPTAGASFTSWGGACATALLTACTVTMNGPLTASAAFSYLGTLVLQVPNAAQVSTLVAGGSQVTTLLGVQVGASLTGSATLTVENLPPGVTGAASPSPFRLGRDVGELALSAGPTAIDGAYTIRLRAQAPGAQDGTLDLPITVVHRVPARLVVWAGNGQSAFVDQAVPLAPTVLVLDTRGSPVPGAVVTFTATRGGGRVTGAQLFSDASGLARAGTWTLGASPGPNELTATVAGATPVIFAATAQAAAGAMVDVAIAGSGRGYGQVTMSPGGALCHVIAGQTDASCTQRVPQGTIVTLTAAAEQSSTFAGWTNAPGCGASATCQLTVDAAARATASFQLPCEGVPVTPKPLTIGGLYGQTSTLGTQSCRFRGSLIELWQYTVTQPMSMQVSLGGDGVSPAFPKWMTAISGAPSTSETTSSLQPSVMLAPGTYTLVVGTTDTTSVSKGYWIGTYPSTEVFPGCRSATYTSLGVSFASDLVADFTQPYVRSGTPGTLFTCPLQLWLPPGKTLRARMRATGFAPTIFLHEVQPTTTRLVDEVSGPVNGTATLTYTAPAWGATLVLRASTTLPGTSGPFTMTIDP